ncbi:carbamoyltransferase [Rhizobium ruizarguesonis]
MADWILGIASSHDGAACLLKDGEIAVAIREERLSGAKRQRVHAGKGSLAVRYCLKEAGIEASDLSAIAAATQRPARELENDAFLNPDLRHGPRHERLVVSHHLAHAASAVAQSGFESAAILVCDGLGSPISEVSRGPRTRILGPSDGWEHTTLFHARGAVIEPLEIHSCHDWVSKTETGLWGFGSLGGMYAAFSHLIFGNANDAGKVMGLAPYGVADIPAEEFLAFTDGEIRFSDKLRRRRFDLSDPNTSSALKTNLAASVQAALEGALLEFVKRLKELTNETRLCLAGGVALNCTANQRIFLESGFHDYFVVPASDDAGTAVGAAYLAHWRRKSFVPGRPARREFLGRRFPEMETEAAIAAIPGVFGEKPDDLIGTVAARLARGEIGGWMMGPAEFGPRALGRRSIIASPTFADMKVRINAGIKFRESFRPFAPAIPRELAADWFEFASSAPESPFMLRAVKVRGSRANQIPAVVHVDGTGRLQTLTVEENGSFHELAHRLGAAKGAPVILNTSFNLKDEPIVETPVDAIWMLLGTELTFCVIGDHIITKTGEVSSILDLVPRVIGNFWRLKLPVRHGRLARDTEAEDAFEMRVDTPWGETDVIIPPRLSPILSAIDGTTTGAGLLHRLPDARWVPLSLVHDLLLLRRMHVISLTENAE